MSISIYFLYLFSFHKVCHEIWQTLVQLMASGPTTPTHYHEMFVTLADVFWLWSCILQTNFQMISCILVLQYVLYTEEIKLNFSDVSLTFHGEKGT